MFRIKAWLDKFADPDWRSAHKMWSVRISLFWAGLSGLWVALPAFQGVVDPFVFVILCIVVSMVVCIARLTNQQGLS